MRRARPLSARRHMRRDSLSTALVREMPSRRCDFTFEPPMKKIAIIQKEIPHYRVRFFEEVSAQASTMGFDVTVYSAATTWSELPFKFSQRGLPIYQFTKRKNGPFWMKELSAALIEIDLVVAPQELQCLNVPYLWANRHRRRTQWVWWGHGYNFQASACPSVSTTIKEAIKRFMTRRADGLITYTASGADYWRRQGLPTGYVLPYYNTLDVEELRRVEAEIGERKIWELRRKLALEGKRVLLFSGRLYPEKQVDFILRTFAILKKSLPEVALVIIGDGEQRGDLEQLAAELGLSDVHFLGELVNPEDTAGYFSLADLLVMPALVGLAIVHGYAFGLPLITTNAPGHGPEVEYLTGDAGVMTKPSELDTASAIASILGSHDRLAVMKRAAMAQGDKLYLSHSVRRFVDGIRSFADKQH
ncbi:MAG: glycosyltransferase family 4 protein [Nitrospira sp. CG24A]|nr:MAG: glycosyltransferase family 4 protein [Nitrospira sp. CG24A]